MQTKKTGKNRWSTGSVSAVTISNNNTVLHVSAMRIAESPQEIPLPGLLAYIVNNLLVFLPLFRENTPLIRIIVNNIK